MDNTGDGRWLTYAELATIRGINRASAVKLVQRERWPRSSGNDRARTVRVLVPSDWLQPAKERPPGSRDIPAMSTEYTGALAAANARADEANKRSDNTLALANRTLAQLAEATGRIEQAEQRADAAHQRASRAEARTEVAEQSATAARCAAEALRQADEARKGRGRLRRAWDGWRGR